MIFFMLNFLTFPAALWDWTSHRRFHPKARAFGWCYRFSGKPATRYFSYCRRW